MSVHNTMITIFAGNCNQISQSFYDSVIFDLPLHQLTCSCGHSACLSIHGYYRRAVKLPSGTVRLRDCRVKCSECGNTHALLLSSMVPYSQVTLPDQQRICSDYEAGKMSVWSVTVILRSMRTTSNPCSGTTGITGVKSCVPSGSLSFPWTIWSVPVFRIILPSSCRYTGGSTNFFPLPHSLIRQRPCYFLQ